MKNDYVKPKYNTLEFTCCKCNKFCLHEAISFEISTSMKVCSQYDHDFLIIKINAFEKIKILL